MASSTNSRRSPTSRKTQSSSFSTSRSSASAPCPAGRATNYDKLTLEIWTDGTLTAVESVSKSAEVLIEQFRLFSHMGRPAMPTVERGLGAGRQLPPDKYNMAIEDLNLSMRAYNCLRRSGLMTVGQVLEKSEEELLALRNFGRKSYDELREKLIEMNFLKPGDEHPGGGFGGDRRAGFEPEEDEDEELGPVAKALLEALRVSGADGRSHQ